MNLSKVTEPSSFGVNSISVGSALPCFTVIFFTLYPLSGIAFISFTLFSPLITVSYGLSFSPEIVPPFTVISSYSFVSSLCLVIVI